MAIENPNVAERANQNTFVGPIGSGTVLTTPLFVEGTLPTADPLSAGRVWLDAGVLKISAGSAPPTENLLFSDTSPADLLTNEAGDQFLEQDQL